MRRRLSTSWLCLVLAAHLPAALLSAILLPAAAAAQVLSVEVRTPRPFGYFLGDLVQAQVDLVVDAGFVVQPASLPQPGPLAYWLDLRRVAVTEPAPVEGNRRIRLDLTYQIFYAALDARPLEIPGFSVTLASGSGGGATARADVPAWSFTISPLREVQPARQDDPADYMRPDGTVGPLDAQPALLASGGFAAAALAALAVLARDRAWPPFRPRRVRSFAAARHRLRRLKGAAGSGPEAEAAYRAGLLALHRGIDAADGRRVLADDLPGFLGRHPDLAGEARRLDAFFAASRLAFFGSDCAGARSALPFAALEETVRRLAAAERRV